MLSPSEAELKSLLLSVDLIMAPSSVVFHSATDGYYVAQLVLRFRALSPFFL